MSRLTLFKQTLTSLYKGYLSQASTAWGASMTDQRWPSNTDVPRLTPGDEATEVVPSIAIYATEEASKHPDLAEIMVIVQLKTRARIVHDTATGTDESDPGGTPLETVQQWMAALEIALRDEDAYATYVEAQPENNRRGGETLMRPMENEIREGLDTASRILTMETRIRHTVLVSAPA